MTENTLNQTQEPQDYPLIEQKESIKLTKNTKGYGWEIKILSLDIDELVKIDNKLKEKFGDK